MLFQTFRCVLVSNKYSVVSPVTCYFGQIEDFFVCLVTACESIDWLFTRTYRYWLRSTSRWKDTKNICLYLFKASSYLSLQFKQDWQCSQYFHVCWRKENVQITNSWLQTFHRFKEKCRPHPRFMTAVHYNQSSWNERLLNEIRIFS